MTNITFFPVFTIGHSLHSREHFLTLLRMHTVDIVLDVRSSPFSRRAPQFNRLELKRWLDLARIKYSFGGRALGGRPTDATLYEDGRVNYERMALSDAFLNALRRIAKAAKSHRVALLCAEADPIECHRFLLIGRVISSALEVRHILPSGAIESHSRAEQRLLAAVGLAQSEFFGQQENALARAYVIQASRVAYSPSEHIPDSQRFMSR